MKNTIPLIIAVILAAAAVFTVSRLIKPKENETAKEFVAVVGVKNVIAPDSEIRESDLQKRIVEVSSVPSKAIPWNQANRVVGQKSVRTVAKGDYLLLNDVAGVSPEFDLLITEGEWAVPVTFADTSLLPFMEPGMEISILASYELKEKVEQMDSTAKADEIKHEATSVLFPCVKILDIGKGDGIRRETGMGLSGTIVVALNPQQAATLVAAQRTMELYPALRRRDDRSSLKRRDIGIVNETTFKTLTQGLETVDIRDFSTNSK